MEKLFVYLADIHGDDIEIEKNILNDLAVVEMGRKHEDIKKDEQRILSEAKNADAIGVRHTKISGAVIRELNKCKVIARFGVGYDNIDVRAATEKGIIVVFVPDYCTDAVAEHALMLALMKIRDMHTIRGRIKNRFWGARGLQVEMAKDITLGIIGLGRIGGALSRKASGVGFEVVAYDPFIGEEEFIEKKARRMDGLNDLLSMSDIISLNVPLTMEGESEHFTYRMIGKEEFSAMKKGAYLINVCRAEVVDTDSLFDALESGKMGGIATDVIDDEPVQNTNIKEGSNQFFDRLQKYPNVTITPHCGFASSRSIINVKEKGALEIKSVIEGGLPRDIAWVNPEVEQKYRSRFGMG